MESKAHWVYDPNAYDWGLGGFICSNCFAVNSNLPSGFTRYPLDYMDSKYCPNCGKKMEELQDDVE